ncbi:MAG: phosphotransferase [Caldilineaceae bacterium]|nr:phosphotransferase [Caldilineaceae bacterium]
MSFRSLEVAVRPAALLGAGGEAEIYALDAGRIIRLFRPGAVEAEVAARTDLLTEIAAHAAHLPFATPVVLEQGVCANRLCTIEKRIPGVSLLAALKTARGDVRRSLIIQYMETAQHLSRITVTRPFWGEIGRTDAVQTSTWRAYLAERARRSLAASPLNQVDEEPLVAAVGEPDAPRALVHLDYCAANVMVEGDRLNAVIDFGYAAILGDRRMNALAAAAYLAVPYITPTATAADREQAFAWLYEQGLSDYYARGLGWLAAYWTFAHDDAGLYKWCLSVLT